MGLTVESTADREVKIGSVSLDSPYALAPMAGMTDTAFRRLVKRRGGCGLVVTEMVSSEGLVRGIDRTLEYAEYTEEERPVSIQIFGGDPVTMAEAAKIVEGMGADIIDVGGESTRPGGANPVTVEEELMRVIPVVQALSELPVPISLDTRHARVMTEGVAAGAALINDINAYKFAPCSQHLLRYFTWSSISYTL